MLHMYIHDLKVKGKCWILADWIILRLFQKISQGPWKVENEWQLKFFSGQIWVSDDKCMSLNMEIQVFTVLVQLWLPERICFSFYSKRPVSNWLYNNLDDIRDPRSSLPVLYNYTYADMAFNQTPLDITSTGHHTACLLCPGILT